MLQILFPFSQLQREQAPALRHFYHLRGGCRDRRPDGPFAPQPLDECRDTPPGVSARVGLQVPGFGHPRTGVPTFFDGSHSAAVSHLIRQPYGADTLSFRRRRWVRHSHRAHGGRFWRERAAGNPSPFAVGNAFMHSANRKNVRNG